MLENIVAKTASQTVDALFGKVTLQPSGINHKVDMRVVPGIVKGSIPSKVLAEALGYQSVRDLQKQIERERAAGAVILSDPCGGGYYLSNDPDELNQHLQEIEETARTRIEQRMWQQRRPIPSPQKTLWVWR